MATGDQDDIVNRQYAVLPPWFPDLAAAPVLKAVLSGTAGVFAFIYSYLGYAALQTRIKTATDAWLDLLAWDFFGGRFVRRNGETDTSWGPRIVAEILRPRQTREAITRVMQDLTGRTPKIIELFNPGDCGGYHIPQMGGYGTGPGCYGSLSFPNQYLITAYRAPSQGIPIAGGYGTYNAGYRTGITMYGDPSFISGPITDAEIYARIEETTAAGISAWTALSN